MTDPTPASNTVPTGSTPAGQAAIDAVLAQVGDDAAPEDGTDR